MEVACGLGADARSELFCVCGGARELVLIEIDTRLESFACVLFEFVPVGSVCG